MVGTGGGADGDDDDGGDDDDDGGGDGNDDGEDAGQQSLHYSILSNPFAAHSPFPTPSWSHCWAGQGRLNPFVLRIQAVLVVCDSCDASFEFLSFVISSSGTGII